MKRLLFVFTIAGMMIASAALLACASLVPMAWGMPIVASSGSLTALQNDAAAATDSQAASVAFPTTADSALGLGSAFPSIGQSAVQTQTLNSLGFLTANQNYFAAYPFVTIGGAPIPSMGLF